uniref:RNA-directed DNA polymerase n=1 Tax=Strongyloides venezuelensis TaxID=75913 RepID=A0A0K0FDD8_STRVS
MVDSSDICLEYCLTQEGKLIDLGSCKLEETKKQRHSSYLELKAITKGLEHFAFFLKNAKHPILILTDHKPLLFVQTSSSNTKFIEMLSYISEFPAELCYIRGKDNYVPDFLSRIIEYESAADKSLIEHPEDNSISFSRKIPSSTCLLFTDDANIVIDKKRRGRSPKLSTTSPAVRGRSKPKRIITALKVKRTRGRPKTLLPTDFKRTRGRPKKAIAFSNTLSCSNEVDNVGLASSDSINTSVATNHIPFTNGTTQESLNPNPIMEVWRKTFDILNTIDLQREQSSDPVIQSALKNKFFMNMPVSMVNGIVKIRTCQNGEEREVAFIPQSLASKLINICLEREGHYSYLKLKEDISQFAYFPNLSNLLYLIPQSLASKLINIYLEREGHYSYLKLKEDISQFAYFPNLSSLIKQSVKACVICAQFNSRPLVSPLARTIPTADTPMDECSIDLLGPLQTCNSGFKYVLVLADNTTRFVWTFPVRSREPPKIWKGLQKIILNFGTPKCIRSDSDKAFNNSTFKEYCKALQINHNFSTSYHFRSNFLTESSIKQQELVLEKIKEHRQWSEMLDLATYYVNSSFRSDFKGLAFQRLYLRHPNNFLENLTSSNFNLVDHQLDLQQLLSAAAIIRQVPREEHDLKRMKLNLQPSYKVANLSFPVGSLVMVRNKNKKKLERAFHRPYEVLESGEPYFKYRSKKNKTLKASYANAYLLNLQKEGEGRISDSQKDSPRNLEGRLKPTV